MKFRTQRKLTTKILPPVGIRFHIFLMKRTISGLLSLCMLSFQMWHCLLLLNFVTFSFLPLQLSQACLRGTTVSRIMLNCMTSEILGETFHSLYYEKNLWGKLLVQYIKNNKYLLAKWVGSWSRCFSLPVLLSYSWHTELCEFRYSIMMWLTYIMKWLMTQV